MGTRRFGRRDVFFGAGQWSVQRLLDRHLRWQCEAFAEEDLILSWFLHKFLSRTMWLRAQLFDENLADFGHAETGPVRMSR